MARQESTLYTDDLDGSEKDVRPVKFGFDGVTYEIDLGPKNYTKLKKVLFPYVTAGTKVSSRTTPRSATRGRSSAADQKAFNARVREWAAAHGHAIKPRGRVPEKVIDAYIKSGKK
jgi:hypothetical protein